jgi:hypothetical protein
MKITRKFFGVIVLFALLMVLFVACLREAEMIITDTFIEADGNFTGTETRIVSLVVGTRVTIEVVTRSGSLDITVHDESGNNVAGGSGIDGRAMTFGISEDGDYTIQIIGDAHQGRFRVSWE